MAHEHIETIASEPLAVVSFYTVSYRMHIAILSANVALALRRFMRLRIRIHMIVLVLLILQHACALISCKGCVSRSSSSFWVRALVRPVARLATSEALC